MADDKFVVLHPPSSVPLGISILAEILKKKFSIEVVPKKENSTTELQIPGGTSLRGNTILRYLASRTNSDFALYGKSLDDPFSTSEVDAWVDFAKEKIDLSNDSNTFDEVCTTLNTHLQMRTFLSGYNLSIADIAVFASLHQHKDWKNKLENSKGKETFIHFNRWFSFILSLPSVSKVVQTTTTISSSKTDSENTDSNNNNSSSSGRSGSQGSFLKLDLPGAKEGEVITRFPPEPSGYLHIGHAKAALMNNYYANHFKGKLIVRFDDTNPAKEKEEYVENILKDLDTLKIKPNKISYTSDFFPQILQYAEQLIKDGLGYVDDTSKEDISKERDEGIASKRRNNSIEENLRLWNEMVQGTEEGVKCVLRGKISITELNKVLRDPALARCIVDIPHHRTGNKYKVYPLYDFAVPIVDSIEGVTHALRSSEYHDRNPLYYWVVDALRIRKPFIQDFSRLNFAYTVLSKRKLQHLVNVGFVSDWNDPRFPTIQGILRRGLTVEALSEFILSQGASKNLNLMEPDKLWALNKSILDPIVPRYTAVASSNKVIFNLTNVTNSHEFKSVLRHKKNPSLGEKILTYTNRIFLEGADAKSIVKGEEVTLMDWGNAIIDSIEESNNKIILHGHLHPEGSVKSTEKKLTWLPDIPDLVQVTLIDYGHILTKKKLEENDDFEKFLNPNSKILTDAIGDPNLRSLKKGDKLQLERRGYFVVDEEFKNNSKAIVLINIPDGHTQKTASVLTSKPQQEKEKK